MTEYAAFMRLSYDEALKSPDPSTQNGALLVRGAQVYGRGHNDFTFGVDPKHWIGEKADKYARVCHAEVSAILDASRFGVCTLGTTLICGWAACDNCAKYMVLAGVKKLVRHSYEDSTTGNQWRSSCEVGNEILAAGGVEVVEIKPVFWDGTLRRDGKPWVP